MKMKKLGSTHMTVGARLGLGVAALSACAFPAFAQAQEQSSVVVASTPPGSTLPARADHALSLRDRVHIYRHSIFSAETIVGPAFGAAIDQAENEPPGWHQGGDAYAKRFGSGVARHVMGETISFGVATLDGEDTRYFLSQDRRFWARTRHAIVSTFVSDTSNGRRIPAFSRFAGDYGAAFIENTWYPADRATAARAAERGSTALAVDLGFNVAREFIPFFRNHTR